MQNFPALVDLTTQQSYPLGRADSFLVGRNETADLCVFDPTCSRHHFRIVRHAGKYFVEALSSKNRTYHNGKPVAKPRPLEHGAVLQAGSVRLQFVTKAPGEKTGQLLADVGTVADPGTAMITPGQLVEEVFTEAVFPLTGVMIVGREQGRVDIHLPHPQVSRKHACISVQGKLAAVKDLKSANGTFVNGQRIDRTVTLRPGDDLDIGPYALRFTGTELIPRARSNNVELVGRRIRRVVRNRETGGPLVLLDDINLVIRPREFVCLLGPSGSGKSTLLAALSGRASPDDGGVFVNGRDLHGNFEALKQDIAVVPQKDVLHDGLTVKQALWYTAKLRLPQDTSAAEIDHALSDMLDTVGLTSRRNTAIRHLSGGQVKRASLANEILCKPTLLFLDEVTSGLDEQTDREVMNLFRSLADGGKTVVCITHSLANVERTCHLVVILTAGGKLAFVGKPAEALKYFGIDRLGDVYERLAEQPAEHWQQAFCKSPLWKMYVGERLPAETQQQRQDSPPRPTHVKARLRLLLRQFALLTQRYLALWRGDPLALLAMAGQALLVALLLGILYGDLHDVSGAEHAQRSVNLMFLLAVTSFWFGCNSAAKEIVKESTLYWRERDFNLLIGSYYASKLFVLTAFSWVQVLLLFSVAAAWCHPPGAFLAELSVLLVLAVAGVTLGLAISALAPTEEIAITLVPMVIIPQIILSGAVGKLHGLSEGLAMAGISTYWGKRGLDGCLPESVARMVPPSGLDQHSTAAALIVLLVHAGVCLAAGVAVLYAQDMHRRGLSRMLTRRLK